MNQSHNEDHNLYNENESDIEQRNHNAHNDDQFHNEYSENESHNEYNERVLQSIMV